MRKAPFLFAGFHTMEEEQIPQQCSGITSAFASVSAECNIPQIVSHLLTEERVIISFLQRPAVDLYWGFRGSTCVGVQCNTVKERCASSPLKPALCSALAGCSGRWKGDLIHCKVNSSLSALHPYQSQKEGCLPSLSLGRKSLHWEPHALTRLVKKQIMFP